MEAYQILGGAKKGTWQRSPHLGPSPYQALPLKLLQNIDSERRGAGAGNEGGSPG